MISNLHKIALKSGALDACCIATNNKKLLKAIDNNAKKHKEWLDKKENGDMAYLEKHFQDKKEFLKTWKDFQSVIVITFNNDWGNDDAWHNFPTPKEGNPIGYISAYAKQQDYHKVGKSILIKIAEEINKITPIKYKECVDTAPIFERTLAEFGGLGEIATNDLIRTPAHGVRVFIGSLFVNKPLTEIIHKPIMPFPCHYCNNCLKNCPTEALTKEGTFIAKKCSSYLSIETKGVLNKTQRKNLGYWLFGCDDCTVVCPPKDKLKTAIPIDLEWLLQTPTNKIKKLLKHTAIEYAGVTKLRRNAVAILQEQYSTPKASELLNWVQNNNNSKLVQQQLSEN